MELQPKINHCLCFGFCFLTTFRWWRQHSWSPWDSSQWLFGTVDFAPLLLSQTYVKPLRPKHTTSTSIIASVYFWVRPKVAATSRDDAIGSHAGVHQTENTRRKPKKRKHWMSQVKMCRVTSCLESYEWTQEDVMVVDCIIHLPEWVRSEWDDWNVPRSFRVFTVMGWSGFQRLKGGDANQKMERRNFQVNQLFNSF